MPGAEMIVARAAAGGRSRRWPLEHLAGWPGRSTVGVALAGKALELGTLALLITLVPRRLGPSAYGEFALVLSIVTFGSLSLSLGGPAVMARFVPAATPAERAGVARALAVRLARARALQVAVVAVTGASLAVAAPGTFPPAITGLVVLALALDAAATLASQIALGLGRVGFWSFRYPIQNVLTIIAVLTLFEVGGTTGAVSALPIASGGALVLGLAAVVGSLRRAQRRVPVPPGALRFSALQAAGGLLSQFVHRGGVVAVAVLGGSSVQQGYAAVAIGVGLAGTYVIWQAFMVQLPSLVERWDGDPLGVEAAVRRLAGHTLAVMVPLALAAELALDPGLPFALGEGFRGAKDAFGPALALLPLAPVTAVASQASILRLRPLTRLWTTLAGAVTFSAVAGAAVPTWGATGATAALLGGTVATTVASGLAFRNLVTPSLVVASLGGAAAVLIAAALT